MTTRVRYIISTCFQVLLLAMGIWGIYIGKTGIGFGLVAATLAIFVIRSIKIRKIKELEERGMNPYDERAYYLAGKAAYAAYCVFLITSGLVVLAGSIFGPEILVNPYNLLGFVIMALVLLHIGFYYYYNSKA